MTKKLFLIIVFIGFSNFGFSQQNIPFTNNSNVGTSNSFHNYSIVNQNFSQGITANNAQNFTLNNFSLSHKKPDDYGYVLYPQIQDSITKTKWYSTDTGTSLIVAGSLILVGTAIHLDGGIINKYEVRDEINRYFPDFHDPIDDVTQFLPYVAVFGLNAAGVKSKYKIKRVITTMATQIALNLIVIQGLKYTVKEPRPDKSANNSFPSGHTATAFMAAHMLHKEYGERSVFYSIAGYFLAAYTGVFRQLNNKHWISDVFVGAGIGIGVTELAYYLNGKWWKEKGINEIETTARVINNMKPSFLGFKFAYASLVHSTDGNEPGISSQSGFRISVDGAYFFNKHWGIGGEIGFQSFPNSIDADVEQAFKNQGYDILPQSSGNSMYYGGGFFQYPFGKNAVGTKLLLGAITGPNTKINLRAVDDEDGDELIFAEYESSTTFSWATGVYYRRVINDNLSFRFYVDYNVADSKYSVYYLESIEEGIPVYSPEQNKTSNWDSYAVGISIDIMLW